MQHLIEAEITEGLPLGNLGGLSYIRKGKVEGIDGPVALKISRYPGAEREKLWQAEFEKSRNLSELLPHVAEYYSMVRLKDRPNLPSFAMEIVSGYPILDRNITCLNAAKLRDLLFPEAVGQLASALEIAAAHDWCTYDLQYFVLLTDQTLKGKTYRRGDLILFDFCDWHQTTSQPKFNFDEQIKNLKDLVNWLYQKR